MSSTGQSLFESVVGPLPNSGWVQVTRTDADEIIAAFDKALDVLEMKYRRELWLNHGHTGQYGDDGEMQCSECLRYGAVDYRRDPLHSVESAAMLARLDRAQSQINRVTGER